MKIWIVLGLAAFVVLATGYSGVLSIEKAFNETSIQTEASIGANAASVNESEHVECTLNESDSVAAGQEETHEESLTLGKVVFMTSIESALDRAKKSGKPIFLYLHSKSCGWCKKFEEEVLTDSGVSSTLNEKFISVVVEVNEQKEVASDFKVWGTPTIVFLDGAGIELDRIRGYVDAETFAAALDEVIDLFGRDYGKKV